MSRWGWKGRHPCWDAIGGFGMATLRRQTAMVAFEKWDGWCRAAGEGKRCYVPSTLRSADPERVEIHTSVPPFQVRSRNRYRFIHCKIKQLHSALSAV